MIGHQSRSRLMLYFMLCLRSFGLIWRRRGAGFNCAALIRGSLWWMIVCFHWKAAVRLDWFAPRRSRADPQLSTHDSLLLFHFHHRHRLLHGEHFRRFRYRHLPERGRAGVPQLRVGQKSGQADLLIRRAHSLVGSVSSIDSFLMCNCSGTASSSPWKPSRFGATYPSSGSSTRCGGWWRRSRSSTSYSRWFSSTPSRWAWSFTASRRRTPTLSIYWTWFSLRCLQSSSFWSWLRSGSRFDRLIQSSRLESSQIDLKLMTLFLSFSLSLFLSFSLSLYLLHLLGWLID